MKLQPCNINHYYNPDYFNYYYNPVLCYYLTLIVGSILYIVN